ncbi:hypothetical protein JTB14_026058 [Gonioctena quinquepunctata]|nr:hypothetical protein JTB14_026058 [Gonioctena quinquepunctata]
MKKKLGGNAPEPTFAGDLTKDTVMNLFLMKKNFHLSKYVDETSLSTVLSAQSFKSFSTEEQIPSWDSGGGGMNITCIWCMNAAAEFIPPMQYNINAKG